MRGSFGGPALEVRVVLRGGSTGGILGERYSRTHSPIDYRLGRRPLTAQERVRPSLGLLLLEHRSNLA